LAQGTEGGLEGAPESGTSCAAAAMAGFSMGGMRMPGAPAQQQVAKPAAQPISALPPNATLYVNNLNDKINVETLKKSLREVFAAFGGIIDIIAMKSLKRRGQAWIIFKEISAGTNALKSLQGFPFYNKPMRINYARTKSDVVAKADGSYVERPKKIVKREDLRKGGKAAAPAVQAAAAPVAQEPKKAAAPAVSQKTIQDRIGWNPQQTTTAPKAGQAPKPSGVAEPNRTLFVENLPAEATDTMLSMLFRQYPGFQEVRLIPGRNVAFVDYQNEYQAGMAMQGLQGFAMTPEVKLTLSYARK